MIKNIWNQIEKIVPFQHFKEKLNVCLRNYSLTEKFCLLWEDGEKKQQDFFFWNF